MIKKYCDRCGIECKSLINIKIPAEKHKNSYSVRTIEICEKCNKIHESLLETLTDIRFSLYTNIFLERSANNEQRKLD